MIREEHFRFYCLCSVGSLFGRHGERLVGGEKSYINILHVSHFGYILGVAGDIDAKAVKRKDEAIVAPFRMILLPALCDVVGRHCIHNDIIRKPQMVAVMHDFSFADDIGAVGVRDDGRRRLFQLSDSHCVAVVVMLMRDKDIVGLGHFAVIRHGLQLAYRVHFYLPAVKGDADAAVFDGGKGNVFSALRLERVRLNA